jgi:integrase
MPAEAIPAAMGEIEELLAAVPPDCRGRSRKTIANTRSRLKAALLHVAHAPTMPPRGLALSPEWCALYEKLRDARLRNGLSRLVRIASFRGVPPGDVNDAFLQSVLADVSTINWGRNTKPFWRQTATLWNEACATVDGWPQNRLTAPASEPSRHLTLEQLPPSFREDLDAYLAWASASDPLLEDGPKRPLRASTAKQRREHLRLAASTLASHLGDPAQVVDLASLTVPTNVRAILGRYLAGAPDGKATTFIRGLATTLLIVAGQWAKAPEDQLAKLRAIKRKLGREESGLTEKNRALIRKFENRALLDALKALPQRLHEQVRTQRLSPGRRLQKMQMALAIQILLRVPVRMQNLGALEINRSLQWPAGRKGEVLMVLRRDETKNELPLEYPIEGATKELLHEYLDHYRPRIPVQEGQWLFLNFKGEKVREEALRDGITKAIKRELGIDMTPHQFRHLAAAIALDAHPGGIGLVRDLLGHRNLKTTSNFYAGMRSREAAREYDRLLSRSAVPAE